MSSEAPDRDVLFTVRGLALHRPRPPRRYLSEISAGQALLPLLVLFGLNAADELDRSAFAVLGPEIRDHFGLSNQGFLSLIAMTAVAGLFIEVPLAYAADRFKRVPIAVGGAALWGLFGFVTGSAGTVLVLVIARWGAGIGRSVVGPTHNPLLSDYYPIDVRADVFGFHRMANAFGAIVGPLTAGLLAQAFGWRVPFFVFVIPTAVLVLVGTRMREPRRGRWEREAAGADDEVARTDEQPPSWSESTRLLFQIRTLRRIWCSLPFLAASLVGFASLTSIYYQEVFRLSESQRGFVAVLDEPAQLLGVILGIPLASRLMRKSPGSALRMLAVAAAGMAVGWVAFALAPTLPLAVASKIVISGIAALLGPSILASLSLAIPPKVRSLGFSMSSVFIVPGLVTLYFVGGIADRYGIRQGMLVMVPVFLVGAAILSSSAHLMDADIDRVRTSARAQSEVALRRSQGDANLLLVRDLEVGYDGVQVLFGVDFEVGEGEIVALMGTNGAGKSTLLKAIAGISPASGGAIVFDGRDATYAPPHELARRGMALSPGGQGVFPSLTVAENLRLATWLDPDRTSRAAAIEGALDQFPVLRTRLGEPAGNLSGGQQQMLTLTMALLAKPRLLMIDELSLGLAPAVAAQLVEGVKRLASDGMTVIIVEQSVNVALTVAQTAYFMEKGEIRFHGPTSELLDRPDVLRSVFLEGARSLGDGATGAMSTARSAARPRRVTHLGGRRRAAHGTAEARLSVTDISKHFGGVEVLTDVSFEVDAGEIVGFLGPNGAGKTTLFDTLSGFVPVDRGKVKMDGRDITSMPPDARARLGLGRTFQDGRLFPALTVAETISVAFERSVDVRDPLAAAMHLPAVTDSESRIRERVEELIGLLGLGAFRDKYLHELSTGTRRIVDLACTLAHEPAVVLLDEPSSGIAQKEAEALGPLLLRVRAVTGASVLIIEHDIPLVSAIADRMVALDLGRVVAVGAPAQIVHDPRVVASYLGDSEAVIARSGSI